MSVTLLLSSGVVIECTRRKRADEGLTESFAVLKQTPAMARSQCLSLFFFFCLLLVISAEPWSIRYRDSFIDPVHRRVGTLQDRIGRRTRKGGIR